MKPQNEASADFMIVKLNLKFQTHFKMAPCATATVSCTTSIRLCFSKKKFNRILNPSAL